MRLAVLLGSLTGLCAMDSSGIIQPYRGGPGTRRRFSKAEVYELSMLRASIRFGDTGQLVEAIVCNPEGYERWGDLIAHAALVQEQGYILVARYQPAYPSFELLTTEAELSAACLGQVTSSLLDVVALSADVNSRLLG